MTPFHRRMVTMPPSLMLTPRRSANMTGLVKVEKLSFAILARATSPDVAPMDVSLPQEPQP